VCRDCAPSVTGSQPLTDAARKSLQYVLFCDLRRLYSQPDFSAEVLGTLAEDYILSKTERSYKTLDYYHKL
jgi:hypothetical protein